LGKSEVSTIRHSKSIPPGFARDDPSEEVIQERGWPSRIKIASNKGIYNNFSWLPRAGLLRGGPGPSGIGIGLLKGAFAPVAYVEHRQQVAP